MAGNTGQLTARLPVRVLSELRAFCRERNLVMARFVAQTLQEKIGEVKEQERDLAIMEAREGEPTVSESQMNRYIRSRGIRA